MSALLPLLASALLASAPSLQSPPRAPLVQTAAADSTAAFMAPGVSRELARWRADRISDVRYDLALDLTARDSAVGSVTVHFTRTGADDTILDFRGRRLGAVEVNGRAATGEIEANGAHVRIPAAMLRTGGNSVTLRFVANIAPAGASVIRYTDVADGSDYLYTLLVPADANQLFPSFDQPDLKARVVLRLTMPAAWTAVANGAADFTTTRGAVKRVNFAETQPISTYLIAFAAGPWAKLDAEHEGRAMSLYVRRSRAAEVDADTLFALNGRALSWMEAYFDSPYPFGKYDFVLAPAFPFGGMEHPGAVFYNEDRFIFRERPTLPQRIGRAATVYHEVAHMWFGDLVTMRWFDDLWLKEGFATYMAAKTQAALDPGTDPWKSFWLRNKPLAYGVDASEGTTPVWQDLANLDQAKSNYGAIVYNKAPGILKQLDRLVGEDAFRRGVRTFLRTHAYGNASWQELLTTIGAASEQSLEPWGEQYILRAGLPTIEPALTVSPNGSRLLLVQRPAREAVSARGAWPVRLDVAIGSADGSATTIPATLEGPATTVPLPAGVEPAFVFANAGDHAYALVYLDDRSRRWLVDGGLARVQDGFLRAMLWGALWDEVRAARLSPEQFVAVVLRDLPHEDDEQVVASVLGRLTRATGAYLSDAQRARALPRVEGALLAAARDASRPYGIRKPHLDAWIAVAASASALADVDALLDADSAAGEALRAPTRWAAVTRLVETGAPTARHRLTREAERDTTSDGRRRAFVAGAAFADPAVKRAYFTRYLADSTLNEDLATASLGAFNALEHQALTLPFLEPALDALPFIQTNRRIFFLGSWSDAFVRGHTTPEALVTVRNWLARNSELPLDLRRKVLQSVDELERTVAIRKAWADPPDTR